jgi:hypothetical protein
LFKGGGYFNTDPLHAKRYSTNPPTIFGVTPFLGEDANSPDLSDLFIDGAIPETHRQLAMNLFQNINPKDESTHTSTFRLQVVAPSF